MSSPGGESRLLLAAALTRRRSDARLRQAPLNIHSVEDAGAAPERNVRERGPLEREVRVDGQPRDLSLLVLVRQVVATTVGIGGELDGLPLEVELPRFLVLQACLCEIRIGTAGKGAGAVKAVPPVASGVPLHLMMSPCRAARRFDRELHEGVEGAGHSQLIIDDVYLRVDDTKALPTVLQKVGLDVFLQAFRHVRRGVGLGEAVDGGTPVGRRKTGLLGATASQKLLDHLVDLLEILALVAQPGQDRTNVRVPLSRGLGGDVATLPDRQACAVVQLGCERGDAL